MAIITLPIPQVGQPKTTEDAKTAANFTTMQTLLSGQLDDTNLLSPNNAVRRQLLKACGNATKLPAGDALLPRRGGPLIASGAAVGAASPMLLPGDSFSPADFAVPGLTTYARVRGVIIANAGPAGVASVTRPAGAGSSDHGNQQTAATAPTVQANNSSGAGSNGWFLPGAGTTFGSVTLPAGQSSTYMQASGFGFNIPAGATITGVMMSINKTGGFGSLLHDTSVTSGGFPGVVLQNNGTVLGADRSQSQIWFINTNTYTYGSPADTWGAALTPTIVNSAGFGFSFAVTNAVGGVAGASIGGITLTVYYNNPLPDWATPGNLATPGATSTISVLNTTNGHLSNLLATNFGFAIPTTATILGIQATFTRQSSAASVISDLSVRLDYLGAMFSGDVSAKAGLPAWPTTAAPATFGAGATDLWVPSAALTPAIVNDPSFGIAILPQTSSATSQTATVYGVPSMTVFYMPQSIPTQTVTVGLYPTSGSGGAANNLALTLGAMLAGSGAAVTNPGVNVLTPFESGPFALPTSGVYTLGANLSQQVAGDYALQIFAQLFAYNA